jgi:hypothetical protein
MSIFAMSVAKKLIVYRGFYSLAISPVIAPKD